jgi:hypothetical protein
LIRGEKVLIDADLAVLYGVETRVLIQAVRRNRKRFPDDFAFQLTVEEFTALRSQIVISNLDSHGGGSLLKSQTVISKEESNDSSSEALTLKAARGGRRYRPYDAIKQLVAEDQARKAQPPRRIGFKP